MTTHSQDRRPADQSVVYDPTQGFVWRATGELLDFDECEARGLDGTLMDIPADFPQWQA